MKKLILSALVLAGLNLSAGTLGIKPVVNEPTCYGASTGSISLFIVGGIGPFSYSWSNSLPSQNAQTDLAAGAYSVTVTDSSTSETASYTLTMGQPDSMTLTTTAQNVSVHGGSDGCVHMTVTGGTPDYSYFWSDSAIVESPCGLTAGTYYVTVTDAFGCTATTYKTIYEPAIAVHNNGTLIHSAVSPGTIFGIPTGQTRSDMISTTDNNTATGETSAENTTTDLQLFPNPASNLVTVIIEPAVNTEIMVINIMGQVAIDRLTDAPETTLDVSNLAKGNYIVLVRNAAGTVNKKMTVVK